MEDINRPPLWIEELLREKAGQHPNNRNGAHPTGSSAVDALLANEMNELSIVEREQVYEQVHGCEHLIEETEELVTRALNEFDLELIKIISKDSNMRSSSYLQALEWNPNQVQNPNFRLLFLRADCFQPAKAAFRMINFFQQLESLFGTSFLKNQKCISRFYTCDDYLDEPAQKALQAGHVQFLPSRDQSGRVVFCDFQNLHPPNYRRTVHEIKAWFYMFMNALQDSETQRRGFVVLLFHMMGSPRHNVDSELLRQGPKIDQWLPIRVQAVHMCIDPHEYPMVRAVAQIILVTAGKAFRSRCKMHEGTFTECQYSLMTFGVPVDLLPITPKGELKLGNHYQWIEKCRLREQTATVTTAFMTCVGGNGIDNGEKEKQRQDLVLIDMPGKLDVLSGKGRPVQSHYGNVQLRSMVEDPEMFQAYMSSNKPGKNAIVCKLIEKIQERGGRFLKKDAKGLWWIPATKEEARYKVRKLFTTARGSILTNVASNNDDSKVEQSQPPSPVTTTMESTTTAAMIPTETSRKHDYHNQRHRTADDPIPSKRLKTTIEDGYGSDTVSPLSLQQHPGADSVCFGFCS